MFYNTNKINKNLNFKLLEKVNKKEFLEKVLTKKFYLLMLMDDKQKDLFLHDLYYNQKYSFGRDKLFYHINKILNNKDISRRYIAKWLAKEKIHQLYTFRKPQTSIRPIISSRPGALVQADLIDYRNKPSNNFKYVLNLIDVFSRKIFLEPITNKTVKAVIPALNKIIQKVQNDHKIFILHTDAGNEFKIDYPEIRALQSRGYSAQSQGIIEKSNRIIKSVINKTLYKNNNNNWSKLLKTVQDVVNNSYHRVIGMTPNEAWNLPKAKQKELYKRMRNLKAKQYKGIDTLLSVGNKVRIVIPKEKQKTKGLPNYSEDIYIISKVIKGNALNFTIPRYKLRNLEGGPVLKNTFPLSKLLFIPE